MSIVTIEKRETPFVQIDNKPIEDPALSWKAKGMLAYLLSKPNDWKIRMSDLEKKSVDGISSCRTGLQELEKKGYVLKSRLRNNKGKFSRVEYIVFETPELRENFNKDGWNRNATNYTIEEQFQKLVELKQEGNDPIEVIAQSMRNMNKSFYPIRDGFNKGKKEDDSSENPPNANAYKEYEY